jgi:hypothetical protein
MCELSLEGLSIEERAAAVEELIRKETGRRCLGPSSVNACVEYGMGLLRDGFSAERSVRHARELALELSRLDTFNSFINTLFGEKQ